MWKAAVVVLSLVATLGCQKANQQEIQPLRVITLAVTSIPSCALVYIALKKDYFAREGLTVKAQMHTSGKAALKSVLEGKADLATVAETATMFAALNGEKFLIIATISKSSENNAVIGRKDRGISAPPDLKGKRIAFTPGTTGDFFMDSFLAAHGIERKNIKTFELKPEEMFDALSTGKVEAAVTWNFPLIRLRKELGEKGITFFDRDIYTEIFNMAALQEFVAKNPETIRKVLRALVQAEQFAAEHPDEAQELVAASLQIDKNLLREVWSSFEFRVALDQSLLVALEDETRWAIRNHRSAETDMPNYLSFIHLDALKTVRPVAVRIIR